MVQVELVLRQGYEVVCASVHDDAPCRLIYQFYSGTR